MGKEEQKDRGRSCHLSPGPSPDQTQRVCHQVLSKSRHWLSKAECTVENLGLELFFPEGALSLLIFLPRFFCFGFGFGFLMFASTKAE